MAQKYVNLLIRIRAGAPVSGVYLLEADRMAGAARCQLHANRAPPAPLARLAR